MLIQHVQPLIDPVNLTPTKMVKVTLLLDTENLIDSMAISSIGLSRKEAAEKFLENWETAYLKYKLALYKENEEN